MPEKAVNFKKDKVYLLLKGNIEVSKYGELVGSMTSDNSLCFLGEMSLLQDSQKLNSSLNTKDQDVVQRNAIDHFARTDVRLLEWNRVCNFKICTTDSSIHRLLWLRYH